MSYTRLLIEHLQVLIKLVSVSEIHVLVTWNKTGIHRIFKISYLEGFIVNALGLDIFQLKDITK